MQFGRDVAARLLSMPERAHWRDCALQKDKEIIQAETFKKNFKVQMNSMWNNGGYDAGLIITLVFSRIARRPGFFLYGQDLHETYLIVSKSISHLYTVKYPGKIR